MIFWSLFSRLDYMINNVRYYGEKSLVNCLDVLEYNNLSHFCSNTQRNMNSMVRPMSRYYSPLPLFIIHMHALAWTMLRRFTIGMYRCNWLGRHGSKLVLCMKQPSFSHILWKNGWKRWRAFFLLHANNQFGPIPSVENSKNRGLGVSCLSSILQRPCEPLLWQGLGLLVI